MPVQTRSMTKESMTKESMIKEPMHVKDYIKKYINAVENGTNKREKAEYVKTLYDYMTNECKEFVLKHKEFKKSTINKAYSIKAECQEIPELIQSLDDFLTAIGAPLVECEDERPSFLDNPYLIHREDCYTDIFDIDAQIIPKITDVSGLEQVAQISYNNDLFELFWDGQHALLDTATHSWQFPNMSIRDIIHCYFNNVIISTDSDRLDELVSTAPALQLTLTHIG